MQHSKCRVSVCIRDARSGRREIVSGRTGKKQSRYRRPASTLNPLRWKRERVSVEQFARYPGGVLTACPEGDYRTVSLGCFIEHDTAKARLRTSADVLRTRTGLHSCSWSDFGYVIPQTSLPEAWVEQLVARLGDALSLEQHIGFFGVDILVFRDRQQVLDYWVVDIDPYYTDLLSFDDWRRFCLNIPICASFSPIPDSAPANSRNADTAVVPSEHRFVVCSGQLRVDGLSTLASDAFLRELCDKHRIAYSHKSLARDVERLHDLNSTTTSSPATDETTGRWKTAGSDSSRRYHRQGSR